MNIARSKSKTLFTAVCLYKLGKDKSNKRDRTEALFNYLPKYIFIKWGASAE